MQAGSKRYRARTDSNRFVGVASFGMAALAAVVARAGIVSASGAPEAGHTYEVVLDSRITWAQANTDAVNIGGWLLTIDSQAEQAYVQDLLVSDHVPSGAYWFGLEKSPATGSYLWSSKTALPSYTHWLPGEPNDSGGDEKYGSILWDPSSAPTSLQSRSGYWNDLPDSSYKLGERTVTADLVEQGYIVEFAPKAVKKAPPMGQTIASPGGPGPGGTAATAPLPAAVLLFPLGAGVAVYMGRKFR